MLNSASPNLSIFLSSHRLPCPRCPEPAILSSLSLQCSQTLKRFSISFGTGERLTFGAVKRLLQFLDRPRCDFEYERCVAVLGANFDQRVAKIGDEPCKVKRFNTGHAAPALPFVDSFFRSGVRVLTSANWPAYGPRFFSNTSFLP